MFFPVFLQHEKQKITAVFVSFTHNNRDAGGPAHPSLAPPTNPDLPLPGGLHVKHSGPRTARWGPELRPRPRTAAEVLQAAAALQGSGEALGLSLGCSRVSTRAKDFQILQFEYKQHGGVFTQDEQRTRLPGQRSPGLALRTDKDLKRDSVVAVWNHLGTLEKGTEAGGTSRGTVKPWLMIIVKIDSIYVFAQKTWVYIFMLD